MQDFWRLEVCNGFGGFGGSWVQKSYPFLSIWSGSAATGHTFYSFAQNIEKTHQTLSPTIFSLKTDFVITSCAFKCWNALSAVVELRRSTGSELEKLWFIILHRFSNYPFLSSKEDLSLPSPRTDNSRDSTATNNTCSYSTSIGITNTI